MPSVLLALKKVLNNFGISFSGIPIPKSIICIWISLFSELRFNRISSVPSEYLNALDFDAARNLVVALSTNSEGGDSHYLYRLLGNGLTDISFNSGNPRLYNSFSDQTPFNLKINYGTIYDRCNSSNKFVIFIGNISYLMHLNQ